MADTRKIEDALNLVLATCGKPLGGTVETDGDDLFAAMMAEADMDEDFPLE